MLNYGAKLSILLILLAVTDSFSNTYTVINQNDSGAGSFRQAIIDANINTGADTIVFNIAASTPLTINLTSSLTTITEQLMIDGWSQGGTAYTGVPLIEINGAGMSAGSNNYGLNIHDANCTVRGLIIGGFVTGIQIDKDNAWIYACYIGTDNTGTSPNGNTTGIYISNSASAIIGTNADGSNDSAEGNIISGNDGNGVSINQGSGHKISGNLIGTDINGTTALADSSSGIYISNSTSNVIGGISTDERNIISSNSGYGIYITGSSSTNNWIKGNYIGLDITGSQDLGNISSGIILNASANNNIIGSNGDGSDDAFERNVVSCNDRHSNNIGSSYTNIQINGTGTSNNIVAGNYIGIASDGNALNGITGGNRGIQISSSANDNIIGGVTPETRNVLSGHNHFGIELAYSVTGSQILGNYVGTDATGTTSIPNVPGGIQIYVSCTNNIIGTNGDGVNDEKEGNLISGNGGHGITVIFSDQNKVGGNLIGTDPTGTSSLLNNGSGIMIYSSNDNTIGGTLSAERNLISGNANFGIVTYGSTTNTKIYNNFIGTDITGTTSVGNSYAGVALYSSANYIGAGTVDTRNIISGNKSEGILLTGTSATSNKVQGNYIGTDVTGKLNLGNTAYGANIASGASSNILGTDGDGINDAYEGNLISCNYWSGGSIGGGNCNVKVQSSGSNNNIIAGNLIGTDITGKALITNSGVRGIQLSGGTGTVIGGTAPYTKNVICGQKHYGIELVATSDTKIIGNYIGTDSTGTSALGNTNGGVQLYAYCYNNIIGTDGDGVNDALERNLISGNGIGVSLYYSCDTNIIAGNLVGTDITGMTAIANNRAIDVYNSRLNVIGGTTTNSRNILSGNSNYGIIFYGSSDSNYVYNNYIGIAIDGTTALSNGTDGIIFQNTASNNFIGGGSNQSNIIANNGGNGINAKTSTCTGNSFRRNSIYNNTKLGIDLGDDGVTMDDIKDVGAGANNLQNFPFIITASSDAISTIINGILYGTPNTTFDLEFFSNTSIDPSGYGEGMVYIGTVQVTTDNNGTASYITTLPLAVADPSKITATATDPSNNTSEFSGPYGDALPVTLVNFDVFHIDNQTQLKWKVTEEKDLLDYVVESSSDGIQFDSIGTVNATGEPVKMYYYKDSRSLSGVTYYRLKIINKNNTIIYSNIKEVSYSDTNSDISIYPNPGKSRFNITYPSFVYKITIYDSRGIVVYNKENPNNESSISEELNLENLSGGIYFVNFITENGNSVVRLNIIN